MAAHAHNGHRIFGGDLLGCHAAGQAVQDHAGWQRGLRRSRPAHASPGIGGDQLHLLSCHGRWVKNILEPDAAVSKANQISGSQSQRGQASGDAGRHPVTISTANWHFRRRQATSCDGSVASYKRGATGSNPVVPTRSEAIGRLCRSAGSQGVTLYFRPRGHLASLRRSRRARPCRVPRGRASSRVVAMRSRDLVARRPMETSGGCSAPARGQ